MNELVCQYDMDMEPEFDIQSTTHIHENTIGYHFEKKKVENCYPTQAQPTQSKGKRKNPP